jgi:hypothetical protein
MALITNQFSIGTSGWMGGLRRSRIDSAQTNLDYAPGAPERDDSSARRAAASQGVRFCQVLGDS